MTKYLYEYNCYRQSEQRISNLQAMLEYTYNSRQFWLKMFWLQAMSFWLVMMLN